MIGLAPKIPLYKSFRGLGHPKMLPLNLTLNVTYHCPSRCQTCNVWRKNVDELTLDEWEKIFKKMDYSPYWLILRRRRAFFSKRLTRTL